MICAGTLSFFKAFLVYFVSVIFLSLGLALQTVSFHTSMLSDKKRNKEIVIIQVLRSV